MDKETLVVIDENGIEIEMEILFTFEGDPKEGEEQGKQYVLYYNPLEEDGSVYAASYTEDGQLDGINNEAEWAMIEEVFATFMEENTHDHDHEHNHEHDHDH